MKKILAIFLACLMVFSLVPTTVFAEDAADHDHDHEYTCPGEGKDHVKDNCSYREIEKHAPTCDMQGYTTYQCLACGTYFSDDFTEKGNHDWKVVEEGTPATCTENGKEPTYKCANCDETKGGEVILAHHNYVKDEEKSVAGDCLTKGVTYEVCSVCDDVRETPVEGTGEGHQWGDHPARITREPKWNEEGEAVYVCGVCGAEKTVVIYKVDCKHELTHHEEVPATCTTDGTREYYECTICGEKFADEDATEVITDIVIPALGHNPGEWKVSKAATCVDAGEKTSECTVCGAELVEEIEATGHTYNPNPTAVVAATCTTYGYKFYGCTVCGHLKEADIEAPLGHTSFDDESSTDKRTDEPTCTQKGSHTWKCGRDGCGFEQSEEIAAKGHDKKSVTVKATCATFGYTFTYCDRDNCDEYEAVSTYTADGKNYDVTVDSEGEPVHLIACEVGTELDPTAHEIANGVINAPTCTEAGSKVGYCVYCNYYVTIVLPATGHDMVKGNLVQAQSCTNEEIYAYGCTKRDYTENRATKAALGHDWDAGVSVAPTCCANGYVLYTCKRCGETKEENDVAFVGKEQYNSVEDAKKDHLQLKEEYEEFRKGTCLIIGLYRYECEDCGKGVFVVIDGTGEGHKAPADYVVTPATCTEDGLAPAYICEVCGETVAAVTLPKLGHTVVRTLGSPATCTRDGWTESSYCSVCGEVFVERELIPAKGHTEVIDAGKDATCLEAGLTEGRHCSECGEVLAPQEIIPKKEHAYEIIDSRDVTCEKYGYKHYQCVNGCDVEWIDEYVPKLGHDYQKSEDECVAPSCEETGKDVFRCMHNGCDSFYEEGLAALGHKNAAGETLVDDCRDTVVDRHCVNCNTDIAKSHNEIIVKDVAATCITYGYKLEVCENCGWNQVQKGSVEEKYGEHGWSDWDTVVPATVTSKGLEKRTCRYCHEEETRDVDALVGAEFTMTLDNATVNGANYADTTLVSVKVSINSLKLEAWGYFFNLNYDNTKLAFDHYEYLSESFKNAKVNDNDGYVSVVANTLNVDGSTAANTTIEGTEDVVVLYFRVITPDKTTTELTFSDLALTDVSATTTFICESAGAQLSIDKFLDIDKDGEISLQDALLLYKYTIGEVGDTYNATIDLDGDGEITLIDLDLLYKYVTGILSYEELVGRA